MGFSMRIRTFSVLILMVSLLCIMVITGLIELHSAPSINQLSLSGVTNTSNASYSIGKPVETLYRLKTVGSINDTIHSYIFRSIANKIINEYGKGLINGSFHPRYYVVLYSNYKDYKNIMARHSDLESINTLLDKILIRYHVGYWQQRCI